MVLLLLWVHTRFFFETWEEIYFEAQLSVRNGPVQRFSPRILYPMSVSKFTLNKIADLADAETC